jgi:transposase
VFNQWLEHMLLPELSTGSVIVLDNASFDKSAQTRQLVEQAGCQLLYLPPYSPDLNPIEKLWANLKRDAGASSAARSRISLRCLIINGLGYDLLQRNSKDTLR